MATAKKTTRHPSAIKAARQSLKHHSRNRAAKKGIRLAARAVVDAAAAKDAVKVAELMSKASSAVDKAVRSGALHWKTAARKKSRLAKRAAVALVAAAPAAKAR